MDAVIFCKLMEDDEYIITEVRTDNGYTLLKEDAVGVAHHPSERQGAGAVRQKPSNIRIQAIEICYHI